MNLDIVFNKAGIQVQEFAKLLGINRVTVSGWKNGHKQPHVLIAGKVKHMVAAVRSALAAGDLPLHPDYDAETRYKMLSKIVVKHVRKNTESRS